MWIGQDSQIKLRDGRLLGYAEYGKADGKPLFYFHGLPGSRLDAKLMEPVSERTNARIIAIDRPGFGLSDFLPGRRLLDWPDDVCQLADALRLDRFSVIGVSGGGPYVAVCALKIPDRLHSAGIVCGLGPPDVPGATRGMKGLGRFGLYLSRRAPWALTPFYNAAVGLLRRDPGRFHLAGAISGPDRPVLSRVDIRSILNASFFETVRNGVEGGVWELSLHGRPWGFSLEQIPMEVHLWHGDLDYTVPPCMARYQADTIPRCRARFLPDDGHFSLPINHAEEILRTLLSVQAQTQYAPTRTRAAAGAAGVRAG